MLTSGCGCQTYGWCAVHGTYNREPRDAAYTSRVVAEAVNIAARQGRGGGWNAACRHTQALGVWPQECALSRMPGFNYLLQVVYDSLHVLDGGVTMRIVILIGCYVFRTATEEGGGGERGSSLRTSASTNCHATTSSRTLTGRCTA